MSAAFRGLLVAAVHLLLVASLGGKLLWDRAHRPRVWVQAAAYDPELPIRGRYVRIALRVEVAGPTPADDTEIPVALTVEGDRLVARPSSGPAAARVHRSPDGAWLLSPPVPFFIPAGVPDPTLRPAGEELWVEVTLPRRGPPRPIRLGVGRNGGAIEPLNPR